MAKKQYQLGSCARKIDPRLRMVANGEAPVNAVRAETCASLAIAPSMKVDAVLQTCAAAAVDGVKAAGAPPRGSVTTPPADILANVFIATDSLDKLPGNMLTETGRVGTLATATIPLSKLRAIADRANVRSITAGRQLKDPDHRVERIAVSEPPPEMRQVENAKRHHNGADVLVGIIDVQGFDFAHSDFLNKDGTTRFEAIWDQGAEPDGTSPKPYGRVIDKKRMNDAIAAAPKVGAPAVELEPQTQQASASHGTHVASVAAGNLGVARAAHIAAVLVSLGDEDTDPRRSFYDSTRLAHAVDYLFDMGDKLGLPVSINVSLGTNGDAHDSSAPINRWIDALLITHGRCVCVAAGNAGQGKAENEQDMGWVMGRIHTSGQVKATGLDTDIDWTVAGRDGKDFSENELELWLSPQDRFAVSVRTPSGERIGPIEPLEFIENRQLRDGTFVSIYNELYHATNGANYIGIYLSPNFAANPIIGVSAGTWTVRLHGQDVRDGHFDGWIERDDPHVLPPQPGVVAPLAFPSFLSERSNVDCSSISTLACGLRVVAVGNLDDVRERINVSSSQGPTRDGRCKPDVVANGTEVVAASGFTGDSERWVAMTGTSMASPYACGVAALMLAVEPKLSSAQIAGIMQRTARPLPGGNFAWGNDAGFGRLNPDGCIEEAANINKRKDRTKP
jgi:subtilisin family serine protease